MIIWWMSNNYSIINKKMFTSIDLKVREFPICNICWDSKSSNDFVFNKLHNHFACGLLSGDYFYAFGKVICGCNNPFVSIAWDGMKLSYEIQTPLLKWSFTTTNGKGNDATFIFPTNSWQGCQARTNLCTFEYILGQK